MVTEHEIDADVRLVGVAWRPDLDGVAARVAAWAALGVVVVRTANETLLVPPSALRRPRLPGTSTKRKRLVRQRRCAGGCCAPAGF